MNNKHFFYIVRDYKIVNKSKKWKKMKIKKENSTHI